MGNYKETKPSHTNYTKLNRNQIQRTVKIKAFKVKK